jgi:hypothetical protein
MICAAWRDLARDVERNEIRERFDQMAGEATQRIPMRAMWETRKCASKTGQRFSFHNAKIFP